MIAAHQTFSLSFILTECKKKHRIFLEAGEVLSHVLSTFSA